tara:strand:- start:493 stop:765 length:273 start_codon:yes stop_codon:yes gene_type:complete
MIENNANTATIVDETSQQKCVHHWVIADPDGPTSNGSCKKCGSAKEFMNYFEGSSWGSDISLDQLNKSVNRERKNSLETVAASVREEESY